MRSAFQDKSLLILAALCALPFLASGNGTILRSVFALPLVFFFPGFLTLRLFYDRPLSKLDGVVYTLGLSLVIVISAGFVLHMIGQMATIPWAIVLTGVSAIAWRARRWLPRPLAEDQQNSASWTFSKLEVAMLTCAVILTAGALMVDRREAMAHSEFKFTEFWMVANSPGSPNDLTLGLTNKEGEAASYDIEYMVDGQLAGRWPTVSLKPGETWTSDLRVGFTSRTQRVEAWLFKNHNHSAVYRTVWADIGPVSPGDL